MARLVVVRLNTWLRVWNIMVGRKFTGFRSHSQRAQSAQAYARSAMACSSPAPGSVGGSSSPSAASQSAAPGARAMGVSASASSSGACCVGSVGTKVAVTGLRAPARRWPTLGVNTKPGSAGQAKRKSPVVWLFNVKLQLLCPPSPQSSKRSSSSAPPGSPSSVMGSS